MSNKIITKLVNKKRKLFVVVLFLAFSLCAFSEEEKISAGLGLEWNMNSRHNFAGGASLGFYFNLPQYMTAGFNVTVSSNLFGTYVFEPAALFRYYFLRKGYTGFFGEADAGVSIINEKGDVWPMFLGGLRSGYRFPLGSSFYVEPYGRRGYPFAFGIGVMAGISF